LYCLGDTGGAIGAGGGPFGELNLGETGCSGVSTTAGVVTFKDETLIETLKGDG